MNLLRRLINMSASIKKEGYDGISYESSLGKGCNIALFLLNDAKIIQRRLHRVEEIPVISSQYSI